MKRCLLLAFAAVAFATLMFAADLPRSTGMVNDFAGKLNDADRQALETRLRDYERASSNEIAIGIVKSLDGMSVDEYSNRLFKAWGIGKKDRNNGVLLLWAPVERKVRIEVGMGLEGAMPDSSAAGILRTVTALFRREEYVRGLNAGVDGIIARLDSNGPRYSEGPPPVDAAPPPASRMSLAMILFVVADIVGLAIVIVMAWRKLRKRELAESLPRDLARASQALLEAETLRQKAVSAMDELRQEAPREVWQGFDYPVSAAAGELANLQSRLSPIQALPVTELDEMRRAHRELKHWNRDFSALWDRLSAASACRDSFRSCRQRSQPLLDQLRESLEGRSRFSGFGKAAKLVDAAGDTYARAVAAAAADPVNWLLVYDLLSDTQQCLGCADDPARLRQLERSRNWADSGIESPALQLMMMQSAASADSSSASTGSSGFDSGGGGGGFGGGDSGGGGASSSY